MVSEIGFPSLSYSVMDLSLPRSSSSMRRLEPSASTISWKVVPSSFLTVLETVPSKRSTTHSPHWAYFWPKQELKAASSPAALGLGGAFG